MTTLFLLLSLACLAVALEQLHVLRRELAHYKRLAESRAALLVQQAVSPRRFELRAIPRKEPS